jgi:hypothetical protein
VGGTLLIQDTRGDVLLVCFYNYDQAELRGKDAELILKKKDFLSEWPCYDFKRTIPEPLLQFPMGATLHIA